MEDKFLTESEINWDGIIQDWEKLPVEAYSFIFSQVKDRYEEVISESESITNKTFTIAGIVVAGFAAYTAVKTSTPPNPILDKLVVIFFVVDVISIGLLLFPKNIIQRGSEPSQILLDAFDSIEIEQEKTRFAYFNEIRKYHYRIQKMKELTTNRKYLYSIMLMLSLVTFLLSAFLLHSTI